MFSQWAAKSAMIQTHQLGRAVRNSSSALLKRSRCAATGLQQRPSMSSGGNGQQQRFFSQRPLQKKSLEQRAKRKIAPQGGGRKANNNKLLLVGANAVLFFGMSLWLLLLVDRYFQNRQREIVHEVQEQLHADFGDLEQLRGKYRDHPTAFTCMVRMRSRELKEIFPLAIGEVVDVLVEGVGRDGSLNICRTRPQNPEQQAAVYVYPMGCLQRVELEDNSNDEPASS